MERFQPTLRLAVALLLTLAVLGFGRAVMAVGDTRVPGISTASGAEASGSPAVVRAVALTGTIEVVDKNFLGQPKEVAIDVPQLGSFLIDDAGKGKELKDHVGEIVTLIATRKIRDDGKMVLAVEDYQLHSS